ncbi:ribosome maturation factor RimP [Actinomadura montaniterrae]|uniref:Ribosome maturation factor RimP n=1 Tax=Actinomadura montaniterrae TaxID=1803903 RepID=A0A6L3VJL6_9ACTN|nr:ribosome maturation factor RimP [Actinomadura montaniterrae]KAB2367137.1 ribosome maturation factor RimP [Actinomadura montaniterrae]
MSVESRGGRAQGGRARSGRGDASARPARDAAIADLTALLAPAVAAAGFDLEEVDVRPAGRRRLVKIVVDGDGGVGLDDIARLSEKASALLDESDVMGTSPYVLEVTSPGVDRPLTEPRHWRRAVGRLVVVPLAEGGQVEGRVVAADDEAVEIDVATGRAKGSGKGGGKSAGPRDTGTQRRRFRLGELGRGRVQVEFKPLDGGGSPVPPGEAEETRSPAEPD